MVWVDKEKEGLEGYIVMCLMIRGCLLRWAIGTNVYVFAAYVHVCSYHIPMQGMCPYPEQQQRNPHVCTCRWAVSGWGAREPSCRCSGRRLAGDEGIGIEASVPSSRGGDSSVVCVSVSGVG